MRLICLCISNTFVHSSMNDRIFRAFASGAVNRFDSNSDQANDTEFDVTASLLDTEHQEQAGNQRRRQGMAGCQLPPLLPNISSARVNVEVYVFLNLRMTTGGSLFPPRTRGGLKPI